MNKRLLICKCFVIFSPQCPNRLVAFADKEALIAYVSHEQKAREVVMLEVEQEIEEEVYQPPCFVVITSCSHYTKGPRGRLAKK